MDRQAVVYQNSIEMLYQHRNSLIQIIIIIIIIHYYYYYQLLILNVNQY